MIGFARTFIPIGESDLVEVEEKFGFRFPEDVRQLYLKYNGGKPDRNRFIDGKQTYVVHGFLPIKHAASPFITLENSILRVKVQSSILPEHLVQFAIDDFGNYFCFSIREADFGAIYFCPMDRNPSAPTSKRLAASLDEFLGQLTGKPPPETRG